MKYYMYKYSDDISNEEQTEKYFMLDTILRQYRRIQSDYKIDTIFQLFYDIDQKQYCTEKSMYAKSSKVL